MHTHTYVSYISYIYDTPFVSIQENSHALVHVDGIGEAPAHHQLLTIRRVKRGDRPLGWFTVMVVA